MVSKNICTLISNNYYNLSFIHNSYYYYRAVPTVGELVRSICFDEKCKSSRIFVNTYTQTLKDIYKHTLHQHVQHAIVLFCLQKKVFWNQSCINIELHFPDLDAHHMCWLLKQENILKSRWNVDCKMFNLQLMEDRYHFVLIFPFYQSVRCTYLAPLLYQF